MNYTRNIKTYFAYATFAELLIIGPIITMYFIARGLSFTEITMIAGISSIMTVLWDVPTGAVADKIGRKYSMFIGNILWGVCLVIYVFSHSFWGFVFAEVFYSLGAAFKSGADGALIYESLKAIGSEDKYQHVEGTARSFALYAQAIGAVISGFVYKINMNLPIIISIVFMIISAVIALIFKEPPMENEHEDAKSYFTHIKESGKYILGHEKIKAVIFYSMIFFIFFRVSFWYYQPYMQAVHIPVEYFGIAFFVMNIVAAISSKYSHKIMDKTKPKTLTFLSLLMIVSFVLLGVIHVWVGVVAVLLQQISRGIYRPVTTKYLNKHIPSDKRATILSFQSFTSNLVSAVTMPLFGMLKDSTDIFTTHLVSALLMIILTYITIKYMDNRLGVGYKKVEANIEQLAGD